MELVNVPSMTPTRYMGSKRSILPAIWQAVEGLPFETVLDAFSGSGCVGYMFKIKGKSVMSNDFLKYSYHLANAIIANNTEKLSEKDLVLLLKPNKKRSDFIQRTFAGLYFSDDENAFLDNTLANIDLLDSSQKRSLALSALSRACIKKRPRGVFTYVGNRYDDGRQDLRLTLEEQFRNAIKVLNEAVFDNSRVNAAYNEDVFNLDVKADLVYFDPPYYTPHSDNDYLRRYHFVEGLCCNWQGVEILHNTKTKKLRKYQTPFDSRTQVYGAFERLFEKFADSIILLSYSSNCLPTKNELLSMLTRIKGSGRVDVISIDHRYSFGTHAHKVGNQKNLVKEYLFIAR